jgi:hypothetical protein
MLLKIEVEDQWRTIEKAQALVGHSIGRQCAPLKNFYLHLMTDSLLFDCFRGCYAGKQRWNITVLASMHDLYRNACVLNF